MKRLLITICLIIPFLAYGQSGWYDIALQDITYREMISKCEKHFDLTGRQRGSGYKQFLRWKSIMDGRVYADQKLNNFTALNNLAYESALTKTVTQRSTTGNWENIGPFDQYGSDAWAGAGMGRIICTAFHPTNNSIFWVGTAAGGLWKTTDGGLNWIPLTDAFASIGITAIVVNQTNPNIIYILTGDGNSYDSPSVGILKSTNGGVTWSATGLNYSTLAQKFGNVLVAHPTNPNILYVCIRGRGIHKTIDGATSFTQKIHNDTTVFDIEFIPGIPDRLLAATNKGLMRSLDAGESWFIDNDTDFPDTFARMAVAVSPAQPQNVYVIFNGKTDINGTFKGCFKSTNYGSSFTLKSNTPNIFGWVEDGGDKGDQGQRDLAFTVDPNNDARIFAGGVNVWKSDNNGVSWSRETWWTHSYEPIDPFVHADNQNFYWRGNILFANNDGGIAKTSDYGNSWTNLSKGLAIGQFYEIDILNSSYIGGLQDNGSMEGTFTNEQSHQICEGDGFGCCWHTGDNSIMYLSTQASIIRRQFGSNIILWDGVGGFAFWGTEIEMHKTNPDYFFLDKGNQLYRAHQVAAIWDYHFEDLETDIPLTNGDIRGYAQCTSSPNTMYVINDSTIIKTTNLNNNDPDWEILPMPAAGGAEPYDIIVDPQNQNKVWVAFNGYVPNKKVFYSSNGGDTWTNISGTIENVPMRCIEYVSGTYAGLYVGTEIGMFYRGNNMTDWIPFANYLPNTIVMDIEISNGYVYAGTYGRGIWRSPTYTVCPFSLSLTPANDTGNPYSIGTQYHHASDNITSSRIMSGALGAEVYYTAGNRIDMKPGFQANSGIFFEVAVDGCPD